MPEDKRNEPDRHGITPLISAINNRQIAIAVKLIECLHCSLKEIDGNVNYVTGNVKVYYAAKLAAQKQDLLALLPGTKGIKIGTNRPERITYLREIQEYLNNRFSSTSGDKGETGSTASIEQSIDQLIEVETSLISKSFFFWSIDRHKNNIRLLKNIKTMITSNEKKGNKESIIGLIKRCDAELNMKSLESPDKFLEDIKGEIDNLRNDSNRTTPGLG